MNKKTLRSFAGSLAALLGLALHQSAHANGSACASFGPQLDPANQNSAFQYTQGGQKLYGITAIHHALVDAVAEIRNEQLGLGNDMWLTLADSSGRVCAVTNSSTAAPDQAVALDKSWLASRMISAQKAFAANALSLSAGAQGTAIALSTANLYQAVQPGGPLFGLEASNTLQLKNNPPTYETGNAGVYDSVKKQYDELVGQIAGGLIPFGGGLAVYQIGGVKLGAIGVSGDQSCTDHAVAWAVRDKLNLDYLPGGVTNGTDNMNFNKTSGYSHPVCNGKARNYIRNTLAVVYPVSK